MNNIVGAGNKNIAQAKMGPVLIVGVDSQIGSALRDYLVQRGVNIFGTTRKKNRVDINNIYLDLEDPNFDLLSQDFEVAVICAATTSILECEKEPERHRRINVTSTTKLIQLLANKGVFVVYLSSNAVFDGKEPFYSHAANTCPANVYGKLKVEVEQYITDQHPLTACVLRLTKVITNETPFIKVWKAQFLSGLKIRTFSNKFISPVNVENVIEGVSCLMAKKIGGIYHLGGEEELSYTEFAKRLFKGSPEALELIEEDADPDAVNKITYNSLATYLPKERYPRHSFSFEGSDLIVASLLRRIGRGQYIDVGANHPEIQNNTKYFYQLGWRGLAIDGNKEFELLWAESRPRDIFITKLISDSVKEVEFAIYPDRTISSMDSSAIERYSSRYNDEEIIKAVETTVTLFDLKNTYFGDTEVHLLSVDIEGEDLNCLLGANLEQWKPGVIVIETKNMSLYSVGSNDIVNYLTSVGYRLVAKTPLDAFFIHPEKSYFDWIPKTII